MRRRLEVIRPSVNLDTLHDGRGGIFTYLPIPPDAIVEYNLIDLRAGKVRGMHWHPHFTEYLLFVSGHGVVLSRDIDGGPTEMTHVSKGVSTRAVPRLAHEVHASDDLVFVAMLTRQWDLSDPPVVPFKITEKA